MLKRICSIAVILLSISSVKAEVLHYEELNDGDIEFSFLGTLGVGTNTIVGSSSFIFSLQNTFIFDDDTFAFEILPGTVVTEVSIFYTIDFIENVSLLRLGQSLDGELEDILIYDGNNVVNSSLILSNGIPLAQGIHILNNSANLHHLPGEIYSAEWTYEINLIVSAVPIPATMWLFGTALVGFIGIYRKSA